MIVSSSEQIEQLTKSGPGQQHVVRLIKSFQFEAAHRLPHMPPENKCHRLHGHSFKVDLICEGTPGAQTGILVDFADIKGAFRPYYDMLDHRYLNEVDGLENPTAENLAVWIWKHVKPKLPMLSQVTVHETCTTACEYRGEVRET